MDLLLEELSSLTGDCNAKVKDDGLALLPTEALLVDAIGVRALAPADALLGREDRLEDDITDWFRTYIYTRIPGKNTSKHTHLVLPNAGWKKALYQAIT